MLSLVGRSRRSPLSNSCQETLKSKVDFSLIGGKPRTLREAVGMKAEAMEWNGVAILFR
ncbi:hypothetical protein JJD41_21305 [Oxynema sp. CENA135]|uniref:hypothetical protein n=1 Tax=Oxynema sp. CENA135 TaxID=984206 RepID=UPI00190AF4AA|nr:hypothetical protein [Oxynema sp. CENA135]MBK4732382.1 hypothetical protein [Oxynema sp. CENA135]